MKSPYFFSSILDQRRMIKDQVFSIRKDEFQVCLNGCVLPTIWSSKGAALAGMEVERRRLQIKADKDAT
jgi:hypothetical protein